MNRSKALILVSLVAVAAILGSMVLATYALGDEERNRGLPPPWLDDLTDEQREEINQIVEDMKEAGATREEIKAAIDAKLEEWGIEVPECPGPCAQGIHPRMRHRMRHIATTEDSEP